MEPTHRAPRPSCGGDSLGEEWLILGQEPLASKVRFELDGAGFIHVTPDGPLVDTLALPIADERPADALTGFLSRALGRGVLVSNDLNLTSDKCREGPDANGLDFWVIEAETDFDLSVRVCVEP